MLVRAILLLVGTILVTVSLVLLFSSVVDPRHDRVVEFNEAVRVWNAEYRSELSALAVWAQFQSGNSTQLSPSGETDILDGGKDVSAYVPLKFRWKGPGLFSIPPTNDSTINFEEENKWFRFGGRQLVAWQTQTRAVTFTLAHPRLVQNVSWSLPGVDLLRKSVVSASKKSCDFEYRGYFEPITGRCHFIDKVRSVCLVLHHNATQSRFTITPDSGCWPLPDVAKSQQKTAIYERIPVALVPPTYQPQLWDWSSFELVIRSEHDPYLTAFRLTSGALQFGLTPTDHFVLGVVLLLVGGLLVAGPCIDLLRTFHLARAMPPAAQSRHAYSSVHTNIDDWYDDDLDDLDEDLFQTPVTTSTPSSSAPSSSVTKSQSTFSSQPTTNDTFASTSSVSRSRLNPPSSAFSLGETTANNNNSTNPTKHRVIFSPSTFAPSQQMYR
eukprot:TRINITY_DN626_c0_g1_i1.p1 TRINITY_DN626_c0_g1~~TRINITY_DN626_c0_g1_i1.p1  ORF type:complete len:439 (+),score=94.09 TRINITY_DN626_c0_g1_i1:100-1416(+)